MTSAARVATLALACVATAGLTTAWSLDRPTTVPATATSGKRDPAPLHARPAAARLAAADPAAAQPGAGTAVPVRRLPAVTGPASTAYAAQLGPDGQPLTYDPCRAVHYVVSRAHLTPARQAAVTTAFRILSAATGLAFVEDGPTDEAVSARRAYGRTPGGDWTPVLVGWATAGEYPPLAGDVVGLGGSTADAHGRLVSGQLAVDVQGPAPGPVLLHELGHLVGLAHVADRHQLMAPVATGRTTYGAGDLAGLAAAGGGPC